MARAIRERDQHCQFYGGAQTRNLQIHHIVHWADGGSNSVANAVCLCQACHTRVHEGGYTTQHVDGHEQRLSEQFEQQQQTDDASLFDFEKELRNNRESFSQVRKLLPTRHRFRIVDAEGNVIPHRSSATTFKGEMEDSSTATHSAVPHSSAVHSTRVECG
jgi:hypothetical protein